VFLESLFHAKNAKSALVLGHARGVALLAARQSRAQIDEVSPAEVKKAVTGRGRAEKFQVQEMVRLILGLPAAQPADASDALAIAIAGSARARSPLSALVPRTRGTR
jgi:crossover junction endodeoxyribonuclease RuvC